jgi:hypothetical protein
MPVDAKSVTATRNERVRFIELSGKLTTPL